MHTLDTLKNTSRPAVSRKRVGRGPGSGLGKTSGRGHKGAGSRSGYKTLPGHEGGQFPLFRKLPIRGFSNAQFKIRFFCLNLDEIECRFEEGELVSVETLFEKNILKGKFDAVKILGNGRLTKKVSIEAHAFSASAKAKLDAAQISYTVIA